MEKKRSLARTRVPIHEILSKRFSTRAFDPDRPLGGKSLLALFEAARWAPSCFNDQPWKFIFWNRQETPSQWQKAMETLTPGNQTWAKNAPLLIASLARTHFSRDQNPNRWSGHDTGMATMALFFQAEAMGLSAHAMGGFDPEKIRISFGVPSNWTPMAMIAIGYPLPLSLVPEPLHSRESEERVREDLGQIVYEREWSRAFLDR